LQDRGYQALLWISAIGCCWLAMQAVHELGHCLHAWASGGVVDRVTLKPWEISRTDLRQNPRPQFVAWGGPLWGSLIPLVLLAIVARFAARCRPLAAFFAGFALIANGAYLAAGAVYPVGDAQELLRTGAQVWQLAFFGIPAIAAGLYLWHGLGPSFGRGTAGKVDRRAAIGLAISLVLIVLCESLIG
jgi:hypothetical protein